MKQFDPLGFLEGESVQMTTREDIEVMRKFYSADRVMEKKPAFVLATRGYLFTCMAVISLGSIDRVFVQLYPLIDSELWQGPKEVKYSHTGQAVRYRDKTFILGPKIYFGHEPGAVAKKPDEQLALI